MRHVSGGICLFLVFISLSNRLAGAQLPPAPFESGQEFPNLVLPDLEGRPMSITGFRGQRMILHIFASW